MTTLLITYRHKQQSNKIDSRQNGGRGDSGNSGGGGGGIDSGNSDGVRDGNDNGDGNGNGNGDSGNNNGDDGDDGVDGDDVDDGYDGGGGGSGGGGGGGVSGDRDGDGCGNALDRLPSVNDAGVRDNDIPDETDDVDALSGVCNGSPTNDRLNPASYR